MYLRHTKLKITSGSVNRHLFANCEVYSIQFSCDMSTLWLQFDPLILHTYTCSVKCEVDLDFPQCAQWWECCKCGRRSFKSGRSSEQTEELKRRRRGWCGANIQCFEGLLASGAANITTGGTLYPMVSFYLRHGPRDSHQFTALPVCYGEFILCLCLYVCSY